MKNNRVLIVLWPRHSDTPVLDIPAFVLKTTAGNLSFDTACQKAKP